LNDQELQEIETAAVELARNAGKILMGYLSKPLSVTYKSPNRRNPVTDADKASDDYIRSEIQQRFPDHSVLSEEAEHGDDLRSPVTWVVDPLDGTNNFLNGLPVFGVSIAVLEGDRPVVGALFIPSITSTEGTAFHARKGGGAKCDGKPIVMAKGPPPSHSLLSAMPSYFLRMFTFTDSLRSNLGEVRSTGSVVYELAMVVRGTFNYVVFSGPRVWDLAAGLLVVKEAGGSVLVRQTKPKGWEEFERLKLQKAQELPTHGELKAWHATVVLGNQEAAAFVSQGLGQRRYRFRRLWRRAKSRLGLSGSQRPLTNATESHRSRDTENTLPLQPKH